ncbi:hypothetical protein FPSE_06350 [Fusarium pseudograminearum CS3096]|uniref:Uncharacterized protein n=1 Tax=Fusarium pseudograminearum (strain CS3096) TaxID=1028729 RepID=K3W037_FUSPC|nr:hypothetical protein FPSE_06350 [Fusarium pseudograminearum CS3096]EKJ73470.1 hypothetical protein FPSE_06350 [Fusarium pseudograminearum CS3096]
MATIETEGKGAQEAVFWELISYTYRILNLKRYIGGALGFTPQFINYYYTFSFNKVKLTLIAP